MVTASLSDEDKKFLHEAVESGQYQTEQEAFAAAIRLLRERVQAQGSLPKRAAEGGSVEAKMARFADWMNQPRPGNPNLDDSRESIYEGCGE